MPSLRIPESGLSFESFSGKSSKPGSTTQDIIGLTLTDGMIEEMIKCVQNGKPIQLSLGQHPNLSFGNTTQQLSSYQDPFKHELYQSTNSTDKMPVVKSSGKPAVFFQKLMNPKWKPEKKPTSTVSKTAAAAVKSVTAGVDSARETLERSLAEEKARKEGNTTKFINASLDPKRGPLKSGNKSKFLSAQSRLNDTTRSMPSSPALSGIGSPSIGPTSVPASQLLAEQERAARKPIIHLLALRPMSENELREKAYDLSDDDFTAALQKVADKNESSNLYEIRKIYWKELDVWAFNYDTDQDRQAVVESAIKVYDRMRLATSGDEWERLKPVEKRGDGVSLSKIQARIAQSTIPRTPKINVSNADSGRDTPGHDGEDISNKAISRVKKDTKARSLSQPPTAKAKRVSEMEAQSKRILTTKKKPTPAPRKDPQTKAGAAKPLSSQYVNSESDEEETITTIKKTVVVKPAPPPKAKRARDEETTSDSSIPLSKKVRTINVEEERRKKKPAPSPQPKRARDEETTSDSSLPLSKKVRTSDASQNSHASSTITVKTKGTSPQKSSPLASSPPTNASEFGSSSSDSSTPRHRPSANLQTHKRNSSSASSATSNSSRLSTRVMELARKYKLYHEPYSLLHHELSVLDERERDGEKWQNLMDMHERLAEMKREINEASNGLE